MDVFNAYLEGAERELAIETAREDVEFSRYMTMLEMVDLHHAQLVREAEFKVFSEGGTYDDYMYLLEEANKETAAKKNGIFASIFTAIGQLIQNIANLIAGIFTGGKSNLDPNANVQLTSEDQESLGIIDKVKNIIPNFVNDITTGNYKKAIQDVAPIATILAGVGVGAGVATELMNKPPKNVKGEELNQDAAESNGIFNALKKGYTFIQSELPTLSEGSQEKKDATECAKYLKQAFSLINEPIATIFGKINSLKNAAATTANGQVAQAPTQPQQNQPTPEQMAKRVPMADRVKAGGTLDAATRQAAGIESADDTISIEQSIFGELFTENSDDAFDVDNELAKLYEEIM